MPSAFFFARGIGLHWQPVVDCSIVFRRCLMPPLARLISLGILTTLIVVLGVVFYQVLAPFLLPLFLAWVTAILCRPAYLWTVKQTNGRERLAAGLTTTAILLVVLLPIILGTVFAAAQLVGLARNLLRSEVDVLDRFHELTADPRVLAIATALEDYLVEVEEEARRPIDPAYHTAPVDDPFTLGGGPTDDVDVSEEAAAEAARERLQRRIEASVQATLRFLGGRTIGVVSEVPGVALGVICARPLLLSL
jgi:hypothetical protein